MRFAELLKEKEGEKITSLNYFHSIEDDDYFVIEITNADKLYIYGFLRISFDNKLLLTSWDKHYTKKYKRMDNDIYYSKNSFNASLVSHTIENIKLYLNSPIKNINISEIGDLYILLENGVHIDIIIHCLYKDYIYYKYVSSCKEEYTLIFQKNDLKFQ